MRYFEEKYDAGRSKRRNNRQREARNRNPYLQLRLGFLYEMGWGVEQSVFKALVWYTGAKILGLKKADEIVARMNTHLTTDQI